MEGDFSFGGMFSTGRWEKISKPGRAIVWADHNTHFIRYMEMAKEQGWTVHSQVLLPEFTRG